MTALAPGFPAIRRGWGRWLNSLKVMLQWQLTTLRSVLPIIIVVQILFGVGFAVGMGLFFPTMTEEIALYLATGAATVTLLTVGIVLGPQLVASEKEDGTYDFTWSLPVPRTATTAAWVVVNAIFALPGAVAALLVAAWRYQIEYDTSWMVVPAVGLTLTAATLIGFAFAHAIPSPSITVLATQVLVFGILGFTPINYPPENLPTWLADIHRLLPFYPMGVVIRESLGVTTDENLVMAYAVIVVWMLAALALAGWVLGRRK
jgi:ABC-2 type transport system permease protein